MGNAKINVLDYKKSEMSEAEALKTFNCGIGMICVVSKNNIQTFIDYFKNINEDFLFNWRNYKYKIEFISREIYFERSKLKILKNIAILISGTGSNMEAIINDTLSNDHPGIVKFVLSNRSDALGLLKAKKLGIKTFVFPVNRTNSLENFEKKLLKLLIKEKIELICLAGFMKMLSKNF